MVVDFQGTFHSLPHSDIVTTRGHVVKSEGTKTFSPHQTHLGTQDGRSFLVGRHELGKYLVPKMRSFGKSIHGFP